MKRQHCFLTCLLAALTLPLQAQQIQYEQVRPPVVADFEGVHWGANAFADVDGDQDLDVLIAGSNVLSERVARLYLNEGDGNFIEKAETSLVGVSVSSISFADIDGDQDEDVLILGTADGQGHTAKLYTNDGNGNFTEVLGTPFYEVYTGTSAFADVDGDQDQDLLITGLSNQLGPSATLFLNDGSGNYAEDLSNSFEPVRRGSIAFADIDGDLDQDVLITGRNNNSERFASLYVNDGTGGFVEDTMTVFEGVQGGNGIDFADIDGDQDVDVCISGGSVQENITKLYTNDGSGTFSEVEEAPFEGSGSISFADIDDDQDQDVVLVSSTGVQLYRNDGNANFSLDSNAATPFVGVGTSALSIGDVDGDTDLDLLISGAPENVGYISTLYLNDGSGNFSEVRGNYFDGVDDHSLGFADIDGDQDEDALTIGWNGIERITHISLNDGNGHFEAFSDSSFVPVNKSDLAFADVDGDQDQDLLICGYTGSAHISRLYMNDGSGTFVEASVTSFEGVSDGSVEFVDIDEDQDQDAFLVGWNGSNRISKLYLNDGNGHFSASTGTAFVGLMHSAIAFADIDGDLDKDILLTGHTGTERVAKLYENTGNASFQELTGTPFEGVEHGSVAFADVDGDQDQDVLLSGFNGVQPISTLYLNDGNGQFIEAPTPTFLGVEYSSVRCFDVDRDLDQDVLITGWHSSGPVAHLYTNDGNGNFSLQTGLPFEGVWSGAIALADIDGDQDKDVLISGRNEADAFVAHLYRNVTNEVDGVNDLLISVGSLGQNFPNPFSSQTSIPFILTRPVHVDLAVFDLQGRKMLQLLDENRGAGEHLIPLSMTNLPSGIYFYTLRTEELLLSKILFLLR